MKEKKIFEEKKILEGEEDLERRRFCGVHQQLPESRKERYGYGCSLSELVI